MLVISNTYKAFLRCRISPACDEVERNADVTSQQFNNRALTVHQFSSGSSGSTRRINSQHQRSTELTSCHTSPTMLQRGESFDSFHPRHRKTICWCSRGAFVVVKEPGDIAETSFVGRVALTSIYHSHPSYTPIPSPPRHYHVDPGDIVYYAIFVLVLLLSCALFIREDL